MPTVVKALRAVSAPVRVVADFDVLREKQPLKRIVESLGGEWSRIEGDWSVVENALDAQTKAPSTGYVREGPYRIVYEVRDEGLVVLVVLVAQREGVYDVSRRMR